MVALHQMDIAFSQKRLSAKMHANPVIKKLIFSNATFVKLELTTLKCQTESKIAAGTSGDGMVAAAFSGTLSTAWALATL